MQYVVGPEGRNAENAGVRGRRTPAGGGPASGRAHGPGVSRVASVSQPRCEPCVEPIARSGARSPATDREPPPERRPPGRPPDRVQRCEKRCRFLTSSCRCHQAHDASPSRTGDLQFYMSVVPNQSSDCFPIVIQRQRRSDANGLGLASHLTHQGLIGHVACSLAPDRYGLTRRQEPCASGNVS